MSGQVVVTGGGTGGHLKVAKAIIDELHLRGKDAIFIGSTYGQDKDWFEHDIHIRKTYFFDTVGVVNKGFIGKIKSLFTIYKYMGKCDEIFEYFNVDKVISVGGYSAAPATFSAIFDKDVKLYIHEQNSVMGKLNKITSKFAKEVFSSYDENSIIKDYPVANEFFENARIRDNVKTIIFLGGSQGATAINNFALKAAHALHSKGINIIHQTGKRDLDRVKLEYAKMKIDAEVFDFDKDLISKIQRADFAVSRSGASTLWELVANAVPTLFVPFPYAAKNHQYFNAKFLSDKGIAFVKKEQELSVDYLLECLDKDINSISSQLVHEINIDGVKRIVDVILEDD